MLLIDCPWCGRRNEDEFHYGGAAHVPYPADPYALDDVQWSRYLFFRANPKGRFHERWSHSSGCRQWFNAVRDTATGELISTYTGAAAHVQDGGS
jgi:heterotetrameric sarcosine oxidase delta subunit